MTGDIVEIVTDAEVQAGETILTNSEGRCAKFSPQMMSSNAKILGSFGVALQSAKKGERIRVQLTSGPAPIDRLAPLRDLIDEVRK